MKRFLSRLSFERLDHSSIPNDSQTILVSPSDFKCKISDATLSHNGQVITRQIRCAKFDRLDVLSAGFRLAADSASHNQGDGAFATALSSC